MSTPQEVGRVIGKDTQGRIVVRVDHQIMPEYGEMWIIDDEAQPARYFARVVDTKYAADPDEMSDFAKSLMDYPDLRVDETDREYIGYNFASVDLLGIAAKDSIVDFYRIPSILARVRRPSSEEYALVVR